MFALQYENLLIEADSSGLIVKDKPLKSADGRIRGNRIALRNRLTSKEKGCVLAEELGHYHTTVGDIICQSSITDHKQERRARVWAYEKMIGLRGIVESYERGCLTLYDMAEYLEITEEFLNEALKYYKSKYGTCTTIDNYVIYFEPSIGVFELI